MATRIVTKEEMLACKPAVAEVLVPELGEGAGLCIRTLSGWERSEIERMFLDRKPQEDPGSFRAAILVRTLVDGAGVRLFDDADGKALMELPAGLLERLFEKACELNGLTKRDVEALEKN